MVIIIFQGVLEDINENLENSIFLFEGESKDGDESLENVGKKKKVTSSKSYPDSQDLKSVQVSIFQSCVGKKYYICWEVDA